MKEHNQEEYRTLDWIMAQSEKGIYLVVAEEAVQEEIVDCYKGRKTGIYDYKINPGAYSFQILQKQITGMPVNLSDCQFSAGSAKSGRPGTPEFQQRYAGGA